MVAKAKTPYEHVRWELGSLENRLPEVWRLWKDNPSHRAGIRHLPQAVGTEAFNPLRGLIVLTCGSPLVVGEQFILAIAMAGVPREFLCEARFTRRSPAGTWIVGTRVLAAVGATRLPELQPRIL